MATKNNIPLIVAVLALAIVGYSFFSNSATGAQVVTPISASCMDTDGWDNTQQGTCTDIRGGVERTFTEQCLDINSPGEYYCTPSKTCQLRAMDCPFSQKCVAGACVPT